MNKWGKLGVILAIVVVVAMLALSFVPASISCSLKTTYVSAPESDDKLKDWIINQPHIVGHTVYIHRREDRSLEINAIFTRNRWTRRPFRNLDDQCAKLGYELVSPFESFD